jgi:hypothetical protein
MNARLSCFLAIVVTAFTNVAAEPPWRVGVAKVDITPTEPVRLSGYGNRREETTNIVQHIWAKALALQAGNGAPAVLLTVDNCGVPAAMREAVLKRVNERTPLADARFAVCSSHTHCAPMLTGVLPNLFSTDIPADHQERIARYTATLTANLERVVAAALADLQPSEIGWGYGRVGFAQNRRNYAFRPEDHSLPVLRVTAPGGAVRAILTSYACHCTTLSSNVVHGDWAGCVQVNLEREFPGAVALTAIGCGADQNPTPRGTFELAEQHGAELTIEAKRVLGGKLIPIAGPLECRTRTLRLPFDKLPTSAEFAERAQSKSANIAYHAKRNLERLDRGEKLPTHLPYLVQVWSFSDDLAMVFLPGEVTVDYGLRLKRELDSQRLWVNAYANDVPCYIPSRRVWEEGGYEGATAMLYYDRPTRFAGDVEEIIIDAVHGLMPKAFRRP